MNWLSVESNLMLRPTVLRSFCLGIKHPSGAYDQIFITVRQLRVCWCGALSPTRGRVCHNYCWPSSAQSFSSPSPVGLANIFYCFKFEISLFIASYDSQCYGEGIWPLLHTGLTRRSHVSSLYNFGMDRIESSPPPTAPLLLCPHPLLRKCVLIS
jgi:hypothetical protein